MKRNCRYSCSGSPLSSARKNGNGSLWPAHSVHSLSSSMRTTRASKARCRPLRLRISLEQQSDAMRKSVQGAVDGINDHLSNIAGSLIAAFSVDHLVEFGRKAIETADQLGKMRAEGRRIRRRSVRAQCAGTASYPAVASMNCRKAWRSSRTMPRPQPAGPRNRRPPSPRSASPSRT